MRWKIEEEEERKKEMTGTRKRKKEWENVFSFPIENLSMAMTDQK